MLIFLFSVIIEIMKFYPQEKTLKIFFKSFIGGIGWALGASLGFTILISLLTFVFNRLGGLPIIGNLFASIIEVTNQALETRK